MPKLNSKLQNILLCTASHWRPTEGGLKEDYKVTKIVKTILRTNYKLTSKNHLVILQFSNKTNKLIIGNKEHNLTPEEIF